MAWLGGAEVLLIPPNSATKHKATPALFTVALCFLALFGGLHNLH